MKNVKECLLAHEAELVYPYEKQGSRICGSQEGEGRGTRQDPPCWSQRTVLGTTQPLRGFLLCDAQQLLANGHSSLGGGILHLSAELSSPLQPPLAHAHPGSAAARGLRWDLTCISPATLRRILRVIYSHFHGTRSASLPHCCKILYI